MCVVGGRVVRDSGHPDRCSHLIALGLVGQCLGWVFISRAMPQLPTSLVGLLLLLQPDPFAFLMDVALFHRVTRPIEWVGLGLSLCGIFRWQHARFAAPADSSRRP